MPSLHQSDIVFAYFPFEEDKTILKKRPCLVLAVDNDNNRFLAAKITTTQLNRSWAIHLKAGKDYLVSGNLKAGLILTDVKEYHFLTISSLLELSSVIFSIPFLIRYCIKGCDYFG